MQNELQSSKHQPEKDGVKDAAVSLIVSTPPVRSVEIENPTRKPQEGLCNWCRSNHGDLFCDGWPICWTCLDLIIDQENALHIADQNGFGDRWRSEFYNVPMEWEK